MRNEDRKEDQERKANPDDGLNRAFYGSPTIGGFIVVLIILIVVLFLIFK